MYPNGIRPEHISITKTTESDEDCLCIPVRGNQVGVVPEQHTKVIFGFSITRERGRETEPYVGCLRIPPWEVRLNVVLLHQNPHSISLQI